jgi:hypothetical protein
VRVVVDGEPYDAPLAGDLSAAVLRRWEAQRAGMLARLVARGVVKYLVANEVEKKAKKEGGDAAGFLAGLVANVGGNALERADTRSWSLLPDRVSLTRLSLPPGEHQVRIEFTAQDGAMGTLDLGTITVAAGQTVVRSRRIWGVDMGDLAARRPADHVSLAAAPVDTAIVVDALGSRALAAAPAAESQSAAADTAQPAPAAGDGSAARGPACVWSDASQGCRTAAPARQVPSLPRTAPSIPGVPAPHPRSPE